MAKVVGVHLQPGGKLVYCNAGDIALKAGDYVVVEDAKYGLDLAKVIIPEVNAQPGELTEPLMPIIRRAQTEDLEKAQQHRESEALAKCNEIIANLGLKMKLLSAHYNLDGSHLIIFFSAQERIDFRGLVRRLNRILETRVELRQIGPRDEAKLLGGIGKCGYPLCCQSFLTDFTPVSIKMAKEQDLALNPMKISGLCGRLLCCLAFEDKEYAALKKKTPRLGQEVITPSGKAIVVNINLLKETATVKFDNQTIAELPLNQLTRE